MIHIPVLLNEVITYLSPSNNDKIIDATFGCGGHTKAILRSCDTCSVLGIDRDPDVIPIANQLKELYKNRFEFIHGRFAVVLNSINNKYDKILFDFGVSSAQLDESERGFAFSKDGPLDMRMSKSGLSAYDIINTFSQDDLAEIIWKYGNEQKSRAISEAIVQNRKIHTINTTSQLRDIIISTIGNAVIHKQYSNINVATKTFQAIRIFVNDELREISNALNILQNILNKNAIIVTITFHSLEDRIVKQWGNNNTHIQPLIDYIIQASADELKTNPRARSAKLRVFKYMDRI